MSVNINHINTLHKRPQVKMFKYQYYCLHMVSVMFSGCELWRIHRKVLVLLWLGKAIVSICRETRELQGPLQFLPLSLSLCCNQYLHYQDEIQNIQSCFLFFCLKRITKAFKLAPDTRFIDGKNLALAQFLLVAGTKPLSSISCLKKPQQRVQGSYGKTELHLQGNYVQ